MHNLPRKSIICSIPTVFCLSNSSITRLQCLSAVRKDYCSQDILRAGDAPINETVLFGCKWEFHNNFVDSFKASDLLPISRFSLTRSTCAGRDFLSMSALVSSFWLSSNLKGYCRKHPNLHMHLRNYPRQNEAARLAIAFGQGKKFLLGLFNHVQALLVFGSLINSANFEKLLKYSSIMYRAQSSSVNARFAFILSIRAC